MIMAEEESIQVQKSAHRRDGGNYAPNERMKSPGALTPLRQQLRVQAEALPSLQGLMKRTGQNNKAADTLHPAPCSHSALY